VTDEEVSNSVVERSIGLAGSATTPGFVALQAALATPRAIRSLVERLAAVIDGVVVTALPGAGHLAALTRTDTVSRLQDFTPATT
jgi:hypothetical protein